MISEKKAQANRENSQSSTGPTSPRGKARTRLNALKSGLFSKELVVPAAGKKQEEFDNLRSWIWNQFQPNDFVRTLLVEELVTTYWRLQRPRRYETEEIRRRQNTAYYRRQYEKLSEAGSLKSRFLQDWTALQSPSIAQPIGLSSAFSLKGPECNWKRNRSD